MEKSEQRKLIDEHLGAPGRMLSHSKSTYMDNNPNSTVFFNGNVYGADGRKLWFGDVDLTKQRDALRQLAMKLGERLYVTRESPYRFIEVTRQILEADVQKSARTAVAFDP